MRATGIRLKNFRRFEDFECLLDPGFNLLAGPNGSGKTSLLRAINLCYSMFRRAAGIIDESIADSDVRRLNVVDIAGEQWRTPAYPCTLQLTIADLQPIAVDLSVSRDATGANSSAEQWLFLRQQCGEWFDPVSTSSIPIFARFGTGKSEFQNTAASISKPFETKQGVWAAASSDVPSLANLSQWFQYNELRSLQEGHEPTVYRQVREAVLSGIHAEDIKFVVRDSTLMVRHSDQGWRPWSQLSDGQLRLASVFCDLAMRCAVLNSHLGEQCIKLTPGIVTIDELDLHLHPQWQRTLISDLRKVFPCVQFIASSHSPFLLQAALEAGKVIDMATGAFVEVADPSIEDISENVMQVAQPQRSRRFLEMKRVAQEFYDLLENPTHSIEDEALLKIRLDRKLAVFANDPASAAWLEQRRLAAGH